MGVFRFLSLFYCLNWFLPFSVQKISGTIIAPNDPDAWEGLNPRKWLYFHGVSRLTVEGGGTVNGMGQEWWRRSCKHNHSNVSCLFLLFNMLSSELKGILTVVSTISFAALSRCSNGKLLITFFYWCGYCLYK